MRSPWPAAVSPTYQTAAAHARAPHEPLARWQARATKLPSGLVSIHCSILQHRQLRPMRVTVQRSPAGRQGGAAGWGKQQLGRSAGPQPRLRHYQTGSVLMVTCSPLGRCRISTVAPWPSCHICEGRGGRGRRRATVGLRRRPRCSTGVAGSDGRALTTPPCSPRCCLEGPPGPAPCPTACASCGRSPGRTVAPPSPSTHPLILAAAIHALRGRLHACCWRAAAGGCSWCVCEAELQLDVVPDAARCR